MAKSRRWRNSEKMNGEKYEKHRMMLGGECGMREKGNIGITSKCSCDQEWHGCRPRGLNVSTEAQAKVSEVPVHV